MLKIKRCSSNIKHVTRILSLLRFAHTWSNWDWTVSLFCNDGTQSVVIIAFFYIYFYIYSVFVKIVAVCVNCFTFIFPQTSCVLSLMTLLEVLWSVFLKLLRRAAAPVATKEQEKSTARESLRFQKSWFVFFPSIKFKLCLIFTWSLKPDCCWKYVIT